jgi:hypothetical protein
MPVSYFAAGVHMPDFAKTTIVFLAMVLVVWGMIKGLGLG